MPSGTDRLNQSVPFMLQALTELTRIVEKPAFLAMLGTAAAGVRSVLHRGGSKKAEIPHPLALTPEEVGV